MRQGRKIGLIIPTLNEAEAIGKVLGDVPEWVDKIVVSDNGSTDETVKIARSAGAETTLSAQRGYGSACLAGMAALQGYDIIVFLDGDYSDYPDQMDRLVDPIISGKADLVIGSRRLGRTDKGALTPQQRFGNWLACRLIRLFWNVTYTDLGPFRAIEARALDKLNMSDPAFGWTVEMQLRAIQEKIPVIEVPVDYKIRIGHSKISGTIRGTILAGHAIIGTIIRTALSDFRGRKSPR